MSSSAGVLVQTEIPRVRRLTARAGALLVVAAIVALVVTAAAAVLDAGIAQFGHPEYLASGVVMSLVDLLVAFGMTGLVLSGAVAAGRLRTIAGALLVGSSFAMIAAEILLRADFATGNSVYGIVGPLQAVGLIGIGIGIVRTQRWTSWRRFAPLAMGLYVPLVMVPLLVSSGGTSLLALGGYHAFVLLVGLALTREEGSGV